MTNPGESQDFDWVTARHKCSLAQMFIRLHEGVKKDIEIRNSLRDGGACKWAVQSGRSHFTVYREPASNFKAVEFYLNDKGITIQDKDANTEIIATVTLNDLGECMLVLRDTQMYEWQVRKAALEELFF